MYVITWVNIIWRILDLSDRNAKVLFNNLIGLCFAACWLYVVISRLRYSTLAQRWSTYPTVIIALLTNLFFFWLLIDIDKKHYQKAHCLNVFVPLVELKKNNGPTQFIPTSQRYALLSAKKDPFLWYGAHLRRYQKQKVCCRCHYNEDNARSKHIGRSALWGYNYNVTCGALCHTAIVT